jgi:hypothetical protein
MNDLIIILLIFLIIFFNYYFNYKKKNYNVDIIEKEINIQQLQPSQMLNELVNVDKELSNLLLPESSTNNITSQIGGSKAYKNIVISDNNLKMNNVNYKYYSSYRKKPSYFKD